MIIVDRHEHLSSSLSPRMSFTHVYRTWDETMEAGGVPMGPKPTQHTVQSINQNKKRDRRELGELIELGD